MRAGRRREWRLSAAQAEALWTHYSRERRAQWLFLPSQDENLDLVLEHYDLHDGTLWVRIDFDTDARHG